MTLEEAYVQIAKEERERRLVIDPFANVLVGSSQILRYARINSIVTLYTWVELYGFPAIKRPDGQWMSTCTAIDQWIFLAAELDNENRPHSRGYAGNMLKAKQRLDARIERNAREQASNQS